jgi:two-component system nitrogen regulation response regulator NtrX
LRERREDIAVLIDYYLELFANENNKRKKSIDRKALGFLSEEYTWPGNIRELKNLMERLSILAAGENISLEDVISNIPSYKKPLAVSDSRSLREAREGFEKNLIETTLRENGYNISRVAQVLKIERSNLYKLVKKLGIEIKR